MQPVAVSSSKHQTTCKFIDYNDLAILYNVVDTKKFYWVEQDCWIRLSISAAGLRLINKIGLDAAIKKAADKGYLGA